jgi:hypothetical protein
MVGFNPAMLYGKRRLVMIGKTAYLTILLLFSFLMLDPSWGQLVDKVDLVRPLPVPIQGTVEVEGDVNVVNTPEVIVKDIPEVSVVGAVSVVNAPDVRITDVTEVEVINGTESSIPVRITNPLASGGDKDPQNFFSWHRRSFVNATTRAHTHSALSVSKMAGRSFVLTDLVVTTQFKTPDTQLILTLNGAGADRGLGLDFILVPEAPHLVSHFQTGIVFRPDVSMDVSVSGSREGRGFEVDYAITFSGHFLTEG